MVSKALSDILELDYEETLKKVQKRSSIETIAKKVEKDKTNELRQWMKDNNIEAGINIDEDTKRYYPYSTLASQVIGFCGSDNQGLDGIEAKYDDILKGKSGQIEKLTDAKGGDMQQLEETYVAAEKGKDLVLTIDLTIQSIAEKYLENACIDNECTDGGNVIIMNPNNGDILAMATYPNYDLNNPYELENSENMDSSEKNKQLQAKWRNKAIADTYEPGSTFKLITSSAALEEGITTTDKEGEFVFGPLCPDRKYALQIWANTTKKIKVCAKCHHEGKCLKGDKCDKCDCFLDDKKPCFRDECSEDCKEDCCDK